MFSWLFPLNDCSFAHVRRPGLSYPPRPPDSDSASSRGELVVSRCRIQQRGMQVLTFSLGSQQANRILTNIHTIHTQTTYRWYMMIWYVSGVSFTEHTHYLYVKDWKGNIIKCWFFGRWMWVHNNSWDVLEYDNWCSHQKLMDLWMEVAGCLCWVHMEKGRLSSFPVENLNITVWHACGIKKQTTFCPYCFSRSTWWHLDTEVRRKEQRGIWDSGRGL